MYIYTYITYFVLETVNSDEGDFYFDLTTINAVYHSIE